LQYKSRPTSSKVLLTFKGRVLVYLRDDKPDIPFPGFWDFYGGIIEQGESLEECIRRELKEETGIEGVNFEYIGDVKQDMDSTLYQAMFRAELTDEQNNMFKFAGEGQSYDYCTHEELLKLKLVPHLLRFYKNNYKDNL